MEDFTQALQNALGGIPVYLGAEYTEEQPEIPHVVVVPSGGTYGPPVAGTKDALATGTQDIRVLCKCWKFQEAQDLADLVYAAAPGRAPLAKFSLRSEVWGKYTARVADLLLTLPTTLTRQDITRVRVETFTQLVDLLPLIPTPEVSNDPTVPEGQTTFSP
ncbi:hypothetical protein E7T06_07285 [Deinococcus sp. Arct2-2]|uniref:hypothetical protein n=1 Tax=Deinococcus sp. Arct2-2 TaxID=2568653 RepID=UPI0010A4EE22|nr:hypothetical protein [Deinococcus sp. Arct2-2]THF70500.1 hypothetical protein E7T06_07285 [Deinococcus sp. Arct2-2]